MSGRARKVILATSIALYSAAPATANQLLPQFYESSSASDEEEVYELSLDEALAIARQRSFREERARRNLRQATLRHRNARSQYFPRLNTQLNADQSARGYTYDADRFGDITQQIRGEFRGSANADISIPIDVGGVIKRQVRQADLAHEVSSHDLANVGLDVTLEVQNSYLNALRAQTQLDANEGVVARIESLLARVTDTSPLFQFIEVELANARQVAQNSRENADNAQDGLKRLLRAPPEARLRLTTDFLDQRQQVQRDSLLERALSERPDIQAALLRVNQADLSMRQAYDSRKPTVRVGAFASDQLSGRSFYGDERDRFRSHGGGLNISLPLFHWDNGQLRRNKEIARIQRDQAEADAQELRERVAYDVRQQLLAVTRAENRIRNLPDRERALQALQRAEQALLAAPPESSQGLLAQVSNARQAWRSAEAANREAYIDYNNAVFRLKRIVGDTHILKDDSMAPIVPAIGSVSMPDSRSDADGN